MAHKQHVSTVLQTKPYNFSEEISHHLQLISERVVV